MLGWLLFVLVLINASASFGDFLIGKVGDKTLRARLADFYVAVGGDWRQIYQVPARALEGYLDRTLGRGVKAALRIIAISIILSCALVGLGYFTMDGSARATVRGSPIIGLAFLLSFTNAVGDLIAWSAARRGLRVAARSGLSGSLLAMLGALLVALIAPLLSVVALGINALLVLGDLFTGVSSFDRYSYAVSSIAGTGLFWLIPAVILLPLLLFVVALGSGLTLRIMEPAAKGPILLLLERAEASSKPVLTLVALAASALSAVIVAAAKAAGAT